MQTLTDQPVDRRTTAHPLMPHWECQHWYNAGTHAYPIWRAKTVTVGAGTREMARERAARQLECTAESVTVRYDGNR